MKYGILITGRAGSGKSTLAKYFNKVLRSSIRYPLASHIKRIATLEFDWDGKKDKRGRRLLQTLGTECGREYDIDIWVNKLLNNFLQMPEQIVIIDDVRFDNEIIRCREELDKVWVIQLERACAGLRNGLQNHISEAGVSGNHINGIWPNNEDISMLYDLAHSFVEDELQEFCMI